MFTGGTIWVLTPMAKWVWVKYRVTPKWNLPDRYMEPRTKTCGLPKCLIWVRIYFGNFFRFVLGIFFVFRPGQQNVVFYSMFSRN